MKEVQEEGADERGLCNKEVEHDGVYYCCRRWKGHELGKHQWSITWEDSDCYKGHLLTGGKKMKEAPIDVMEWLKNKGFLSRKGIAYHNKLIRKYS